LLRPWRPGAAARELGSLTFWSVALLTLTAAAELAGFFCCRIFIRHSFALDLTDSVEVDGSPIPLNPIMFEAKH